MSDAGSIERTTRCWWRLFPPVLVLLQILALPHIGWAQRTTQIRRSCVADSASALRCSSSSSEGDARVRFQLASVKSEFRESEGRAIQLAERCRADVTASSELAVQSVDRLSRQHDSLGDRLTALGATLRNSLQMASIAAKSELLVVKNEMRSNMSSLADDMTSELYNTNVKINVSAHRLASLFTINGQQMAAINQLNQTQKYTEAIWGQQVSALGVQLNSAKGEMARNFSSLIGALELVRYSMNDGRNVSLNQMSIVTAVINKHTAAISYLNRTQQQSDVRWKHQVLNLTTEMNSLLSNMMVAAALFRVIEQQMHFSTRILLSTVTAVCSLNQDLMSSLPQCQGLNSFSNNITSYINDVSGEMQKLRQQVASNDTALTANQEGLQRRSTAIQHEIDSFSANIAQQARTISAAECKTPWVLYKSSCYVFGKQRMNHEQSNAMCTRFGGYLVRVDNKSESNFLRDMMMLSDIDKAWIGLVRHITENRFVWQTGGPYSYEAWLAGEPNNDLNNERCTQMLRVANEDDCRLPNIRPSDCQRAIRDSLSWNDVPCGTLASVICERHL